MDEPSTTPPQLPPPFDWSRFDGRATVPPGGPPTFGAPPSPTAPHPPSSRGEGDGGRRRHPAHRARIAAAVVSGAAFVGLVGCTALTGGDDADTTDRAPSEQYRSEPPASSGGDSYDGSDGDGGGAQQHAPPEQSSPPDWGGSAAPGSGGSSGHATRSQGS